MRLAGLGARGLPSAPPPVAELRVGLGGALPLQLGQGVQDTMNCTYLGPVCIVEVVLWVKLFCQRAKEGAVEVPGGALRVGRRQRVRSALPSWGPPASGNAQSSPTLPCPHYLVAWLQCGPPPPPPAALQQRRLALSFPRRWKPWHARAATGSPIKLFQVVSHKAVAKTVLTERSAMDQWGQKRVTPAKG